MSGVLVQAGAQRWRLLTDPEPREAARFQAILGVQLLDELTGAPPLAAIRVSTGSPGMTATAVASGRIGLVGRPAALFPDVWPVAAPSVDIRAETGDHLPLSLATTLDPQPAMPDRYTLTDLGAVDLHRRPTIFSGRVVSRLSGPPTSATVSVASYWPTFAAIGGAGLPANALCLWSGLYADRPGATTTVRRCPLTPQPDIKILNRAAAAGATQLLLSDRQGLLTGRPIAIEPGHPEREEYVAVAAIDTALSNDQPALVTLAHPLRRAHAIGTIVARTVAGPLGTTVRTLDRPGRGGDVSIYLDGLAGLSTTDRVVEIDTPGPLAKEYHSFSLWRADTGSEGGFRLPPIHRAAHLEIQVAGPPGVAPVRVSLNAPGDALADILFD
jgi:hypothetical protein